MISDTYASTDYCIETNIIGSSDSIYIAKATSTPIQQNIVVSSAHTLTFWGQILALNGLPLYKVQIELIEIHYFPPNFHFIKIAETTTDQSGFYYFVYRTSTIYCYFLHVLSNNTLCSNLLFSSFNHCISPLNDHCICYDSFKKEMCYDIT